ncbi:hypothetical protein JCM15519_14540 [Fundidesulfovibrio butyratiphilus]
MKPGSRLGKDPLGRQTGADAALALRNILEPSTVAVPPKTGEALSLAGERFTKALSRLMTLAAQAGLLPDDGPRDRTMLLLIRLIEALRLRPDSDGVDMAAYLDGVSGPWTLDCAHDLSPAHLRAALSLALGLDALNACLRAHTAPAAAPLTLRVEGNGADCSRLRLYGAREAFPETLEHLEGPLAADIKTLARRGLLSVRLLSSQNAREVRLDAPMSL